MKYEEAQELAKKVKWKTSLCHQGETCWCRIIEPEKVILFDDFFETGKEEEFTIIDSGSINKEFAEYIVDLHNKSLENK